MDYQFSKEGLQLAVFKMTLENNALLHAMLNVLSRIYLEMAKAPSPESFRDELELLRAQFEENSRNMARTLESLSLEGAAAFAAAHDTRPDGPTVLSI